MIKRIAFVVVGALGLLVVVLFALPLVFGDAVTARVDAALERRVDARVSHGDVSLGLFRHFPDLAVTVDDPTVTGVGAFEGDTLAHADRLRLVMDLGSVIRLLRRGEPLVVRQVRVDRPTLRTLVLEDGRASWDILKAVEEAAEGPDARGRPAVRVALKQLEVRGGAVSYEDRGRGLEAEVRGIEHTLAGDFATDRFTLQARAAADSVTLRHGGIPYLSRARVALDAELDADLSRGRYALRENRLVVNALGLGFDGVIERLDDGLALDLAFDADEARLRDLLSLIPAVYTTDFDELEADGAVTVAGNIRGRTGDGRMPSFDLAADVADGRFRYADLPVGFTDVFLDLSVRQPAASLDSAVVAVDRLAFTVGDDPFTASFTLRTPVSDPDVTAGIAGRLDLGAAGRALKLDGIDELGGRIVADAAFHARRSWVEARDYDRIEARGQVRATDVRVAGGALPVPVSVEALTLELSPRQVQVPVLRARIGASDLRGSGRLDNLPGFLLRDELLEGSAELRSHHVALDEWQRDAPLRLRVIPVPPGVDLAVSVAIDSVTLGRLVATEARGDLVVRDRRVTFRQLGLAALGGAMVLDGWYDTADPTSPRFDLALGIAGVAVREASTTLNTVRAFAPVAAYATGAFSGDLALTGRVGDSMTTVLSSLSGEGGIRTRALGIRDMPALDRLADALRIEALRSPAVSDFAASIRVDDGRLHVRPFDVRLGPVAATVAGSNGFDGSLDYRLELRVPRTLLGAEANRVIEGLREGAGRVGLRLAEAEAVRVEAGIGGTVRDPRISLDLAEPIAAATADLAEQARARAEAEAARRVAEARDRVEAARAQAEVEARVRLEEARRRARERSDSILVAAQAQAERLRAEARRAGDRLREEADRQAEQLVARAGNPVARGVAEAAGERLREEAERRATRLVEEADLRADQVLEEARQRADQVLEAVDEPVAGQPGAPLS